MWGAGVRHSSRVYFPAVWLCYGLRLLWCHWISVPVLFICLSVISFLGFLTSCFILYYLSTFCFLPNCFHLWKPLVFPLWVPPLSDHWFISSVCPSLSFFVGDLYNKLNKRNEKVTFHFFCLADFLHLCPFHTTPWQIKAVTVASIA